MGERTYFGAGWLGGVLFQNDHVCAWHSKNIRWPINSKVEDLGYYYADPDAPASGPKTIEYNDLWFGSEHPGGAQFVMADGSTHFVSEGIDFALYGDLATIVGKELAQLR